MNNPTSSEYPSITAYDINNSTVLNQIYSLIQSLSTTYGTSRNPFRLYAIGFGPVFQGANASSAKTTLQTMQYYAGTQSSASTALPSNQIITGTDSPDVDEHDRHVHPDPGKRRANRAHQVAMPNAVAEFIDVSKTYRRTLRPAARSRPCAGSASRIEPGEALRFWARTGPARQPCSRSSWACAVPAQAACFDWAARFRSGARSPASATCTKTRRFPVT